MKIVTQYLERNSQKIKEIFDSFCQDEELPATKIFNFLQQVFNLSTITFLKDGKEFFKEDSNENYTERVVQQYYKTTPEGRSGKFYLYRISFEYEEVLEFLDYWFNTDKTFTIHDPMHKQQHQPQQSSQQIQLSQIQEQKTKGTNIAQSPQQNTFQENEFSGEEEKKNMLIAAYQGQIKKMEEMQLRVEGVQNSEQLTRKIAQLKNKIKQLSTKEYPPSNKSSSETPSPKKPKTEGFKEKKINFKAIFDFYAKQNHLTGVKASFQRIEHQSQTINYQKLVHFLKECDLFPEKAKEQKKVHNIYVRTCSNTRDLFFPQFMELLQKLPQIVIELPQGSLQSKKEVMMAQIQSKTLKNKVLHNPFHSPEKEDFRINKDHLKYEFKLKPIKGKLQMQVNIDLEHRKKQKQENKLQIFKEKQQKKMQKLQKLMSIDPYHPMVIKNSHLLNQRSKSIIQQPVANLNNMEKFRDASFDMKSKFGIADFEEDPFKAMVHNRYDLNKRAEMIEREQSLKMSNLMSGIVQRSQAKLMKLGLSPNKKQGKTSK